MLRLSWSNPRKKYEIDIKCDCEFSRKTWRVHEGHDFEASSQFQAAEASKLNPRNLTGSPKQSSIDCAARERSPRPNSNRSHRCKPDSPSTSASALPTSGAQQSAC